MPTARLHGKREISIDTYFEIASMKNNIGRVERLASPENPDVYLETMEEAEKKYKTLLSSENGAVEAYRNGNSEKRILGCAVVVFFQIPLQTKTRIRRYFDSRKIPSLHMFS